ncbi:MAG: sigma 54-interacting transcriptional regulator [Alphaproteobacteria bacterium]|nr:sigma 54-interacting transcriptional regulator [Alphaproteobacteria bacterium]MCB9794706.1 sigma 54-interacting transcriptional regulator [Alphaproteobacteria bacterium]
MAKSTVVIGLIGTRLDAGAGRKRWSRWRPTVSIGMHEDLLISRMELLVQPNRDQLAAQVVEDLAEVSPETEVRLHEISMVDPWDFEAVYAELHGFARSYDFNTEDEDYLIHITTGSHVAQICLFLLTESRHLPGRLLQTSPPRGLGAGAYTLIDLDLSRYDQLASRFAQEDLEGADFLRDGIPTRNAPFNRLIERVGQVAVASRSPILLMGPTGAGKSQLARRIYALKQRRRQMQGPLVEVNCATLRGDAAMSALFGHVRGSFTGASRDRAGLLRAADGGVLFLDEIGELGPDEQAMLLRALEHKRFMPVGADREVASDFQLIAGTNADLNAAARAGAFRADLLARINLWTFRLPPLAERQEDIEPNLDYELERFTREHGRQVRFSREARRQFLDFAVGPRGTWSANFRDLNATVTRMATLSEGGRVTEEVVDEELKRLQADWGSPGPESSRIDALFGPDVELDRFDRVQLEDVLAVCARAKSLSAAGRELFAVSREQKKSSNDADRLRKYLLRFGLSWEQVSGD